MGWSTRVEVHILLAIDPADYGPISGILLDSPHPAHQASLGVTLVNSWAQNKKYCWFDW